MSSSVYNLQIIINNKLQEQHQRQSVSTEWTSKGIVTFQNERWDQKRKVQIAKY